MLLLITKYNLSPKWVHFITALILYFICIKLHYLEYETNIADCMQRNSFSEEEEYEKKIQDIARNDSLASLNTETAFNKDSETNIYTRPLKDRLELIRTRLASPQKQTILSTVFYPSNWATTPPNSVIIKNPELISSVLQESIDNIDIHRGGIKKSFISKTIQDFVTNFDNESFKFQTDVISKLNKFEDKLNCLQAKELSLNTFFIERYNNCLLETQHTERIIEDILLNNENHQNLLDRINLLQEERQTLLRQNNSLQESIGQIQHELRSNRGIIQGLQTQIENLTRQTEQQNIAIFGSTDSNSNTPHIN